MSIEWNGREAEAGKQHRQEEVNKQASPQDVCGCRYVCKSTRYQRGNTTAARPRSVQDEMANEDEGKHE